MSNLLWYKQNGKWDNITNNNESISSSLNERNIGGVIWASLPFNYTELKIKNY